MSSEQLPELVRTLLLSGFHLDRIQRLMPATAILHMHSFTAFGHSLPFVLLYGPEEVLLPHKRQFEKLAEGGNSFPITIGTCSIENIPHFDIKQFFRLLGGPIESRIVHDDTLSALLNDLGHNRLPEGFVGEPNDLLEEFSKQSLQYVLGGQGRRYGRDRSFEKLPDGVVFDTVGTVLLLDTKAYAEGFPVSADDLRRFSDYTERFNNQYSAYFGRVHALIVVSSEFTQTDRQLTDRRNEFYGRCQTALTFIKAEDLGLIVKLIRENVMLRPAVDWKRLFSQLTVSVGDVSNEIQRLIKDGMLRRN